MSQLGVLAPSGWANHQLVSAVRFSSDSRAFASPSFASGHLSVGRDQGVKELGDSAVCAAGAFGIRHEADAPSGTLQSVEENTLVLGALV